jgi:hypothetical protein
VNRWSVGKHNNYDPDSVSRLYESWPRKIAKSVRSVRGRRLESKKATGIERILDQFQFHLPELMRDKLAEAATANGRSLNDESSIDSRNP